MQTNRALFAVENNEALNTDGANAAVLAESVRVIKSALVKARPMKLLRKEKLCCNRATD